jgi:hypothetical protein
MRRRGRDSNPRCRGYPHNGFRDRDKALYSPHETWSQTAGGIPGGMKAQVARPRDSAATASSMNASSCRRARSIASGSVCV